MQHNTLTRRTGFAPRQKPMARRQQPLAPVSQKHTRQQAAQRRAYAAAPAREWCEVCGVAGPVEHSHLFSQKHHPEHRSNPLNWLLKCRSCHELFENNKPAFAARHPKAWARILHQMQQVDPAAFAAWVALHPELTFSFSLAGRR